jgi:TPR repeat protein
MSEGLKELGTKAFQERDFERAIELYTRAIEQEDRANNHVLFSNRSAAKVRLTSNVVF